MIVLGQGNNQPVYMELDTATGNVKNFVSVDWNQASYDVVPIYSTSSGFFNDKSDPLTGKEYEYIYMSFIMDKEMRMLRMKVPKNNPQRPTIDWSIRFPRSLKEEEEVDDGLNDATFMEDDIANPNNFFWFGRL